MKRGMLIVLLAVAVFGVYGYYNPERVRALQHWLAGWHLATEPTTTLYRWRDERGRWRVTDEPPPSGTPYEELEYRRDTNVLPPPEADRKE